VYYIDDDDDDYDDDMEFLGCHNMERFITTSIIHVLHANLVGKM